MAEYIRGKIVKTRKEHTCFDCLEKFPKGTTMSAETSKENGEIYTLHICVDCRQYMDDNMDSCFDELQQCFYEGCVREARLCQ